MKGCKKSAGCAKRSRVCGECGLLGYRRVCEGERSGKLLGGLPLGMLACETTTRSILPPPTRNMTLSPSLCKTHYPRSYITPPPLSTKKTATVWASPRCCTCWAGAPWLAFPPGCPACMWSRRLRRAVQQVQYRLWRRQMHAQHSCRGGGANCLLYLSRCAFGVWCGGCALTERLFIVQLSSCLTASQFRNTLLDRSLPTAAAAPVPPVHSNPKYIPHAHQQGG